MSNAAPARILELPTVVTQDAAKETELRDTRRVARPEARHGPPRTPGMATRGVGVALIAQSVAEVVSEAVTERAWEDISDDEWAWVVDDGWVYDIGDELPEFGYEPAPFDETPWFDTPMRRSRIRSVPHGPVVKPGGDIEVEIEPETPPEIVIPGKEVIRTVGVPEQVPRRWHTPSEVPRIGRPRTRPIGDAPVPPFIYPSRIRTPRVNWDVVPEVDLWSFRLTVRRVARYGPTSLVVRALDRTGVNARLRFHRLQHDRKTRSAALYLAMVRFVNRTWGHASELLDFFNVLRWSIIIHPREGTVILAESVREPGAHYEIRLRGSQRLGSLPLNGQRAAFHMMADGRLDYSVDWEFLLLGHLSNEAMDLAVGYGMKLENKVLHRHRRGALKYGNISTWYRRQQWVSGV